MQGLMEHPTFYRTAQIDGLSIFYREAGPKDAPTLVLLHGLPSSSRRFEPLFARLSDRYQTCRVQLGGDARPCSTDLVVWTLGSLDVGHEGIEAFCQCGVNEHSVLE
jgi:hypothetical protein